MRGSFRRCPDGRTVANDHFTQGDPHTGVTSGLET
jgi:hypothetical protein